MKDRVARRQTPRDILGPATAALGDLACRGGHGVETPEAGVGPTGFS